jgi:hypothetical protein
MIFVVGCWPLSRADKTPCSVDLMALSWPEAIFVGSYRSSTCCQFRGRFWPFVEVLDYAPDPAEPNVQHHQAHALSGWKPVRGQFSRRACAMARLCPEAQDGADARDGRAKRLPRGINGLTISGGTIGEHTSLQRQ